MLEDGPELEAIWRRGERLHETSAVLLWGMANPLVPRVHLSRWREDLPQARVEELEG